MTTAQSFTFTDDQRAALVKALRPGTGTEAQAAVDMLEEAARTFIADPARTAREAWLARAQAAAPAGGWPKGVVLARTPGELQEQLERAAVAVDHAFALVATLPPNEAFHPNRGYRLPVRWPVFDPEMHTPGEAPAVTVQRRATRGAWLRDTEALSVALRAAARDVDGACPDVVRDFDATIGLAVFLCTGDVSAGAVTPVLEVLEEIDSLGRRVATPGLVTRVRRAVEDTYIRPGVRVRDVAPSFRA